jgi:Cupin superfamily protein
MNGLAALVGPDAVDAYLRESYGRRLFRQAGPSDRFQALLSWSDLNRILEDHRLSPPRLRLARDGASLPEDLYTRPQTSRRGLAYAVLEPAGLREQLRAGATLILDNVDQLHPPVRALAAALERDVGERVQVNLYASWVERRGFGLHWDDHDVLILQVAGRKRWRVYGETRPAPLHRDVAPPEEPSGEPDWDGVVEAGGLLSIPRGHWHDAVAGGEPSLHLTVGILRSTGIDLVEWLTDRLRGVELYRRDLPRPAGVEERRERSRRLREALLERWSDDLVDEFFAARDAHARPWPRLSLPWGIVDRRLAADRVLQASLPRPLPLLPHADGVELRALGRSWVFDATARPMLELALDGRAHPVGELIAAGPPGAAEQRRELLVFLCEHDLLAPAD